MFPEQPHHVKTAQHKQRTLTNSVRTHVTLETIKIKGFYLSQQMKTETNPTWRDTVRRTLQQYSIFYQEEKGSGIWYLREEKPLGDFDPKKNPNPGHEDVQRMLLELGTIYGYETSAAINDARKKFMNMPIEEVATIKEFQRDVFHPRLWK